MQGSSDTGAVPLPAPDKLSGANLQTLQANLQSDTKYTEGLAAEESAQIFHQASHDHHLGHFGLHGTESPDQLDAIRRSIPTDMEQVFRLHRPRGASNSTPYERFLVASHIPEPFPLHAKKAMSDSGLKFGFQESIEVRAEAARLLASDNDEDGDDDVVRTEDIPRAYTVPLDSRSRVRNVPRMFKRNKRPAAETLEAESTRKRRQGTW